MIGKLFWVLLTAVFTFGFVVLFENGPDNYLVNCQTEFQDLRAYVVKAPKKKPDVASPEVMRSDCRALACGTSHGLG